MEVSAKTGHNIKEFFKEMACVIAGGKKAKEEPAAATKAAPAQQEGDDYEGTDVAGHRRAKRGRKPLDPALGIGISNAIGRPKNGPEEAPGRARRGPKYASLGGFWAQSGRLEARGWRVGRSLNVHGAQDWPGLRVDPDVGHGLPTRRAAPPAAAG